MRETAIEEIKGRERLHAYHDGELNALARWRFERRLRRSKPLRRELAALARVVLGAPGRSRRHEAAMDVITPEIDYQASMGYPSTGFGVFMDPYPLSEKLFLVSHDPRPRHRGENGFGIYVLDAWGNRAELYM